MSLRAPIIYDNTLIASATAKMLLEIEAVHFRPNEPFIFTSGLASPVYIDCRKLISYPRMRRMLVEFCMSTIFSKVGYEKLDTIVGGETAGIPFASWVADKLSLPMHYVRKKPKGFGRNAKIEGCPIENMRALLVEDLATDGGSKVAFADGIRSAGATISDVVVIFFHDLNPDALRLLNQHGLSLHYLATWRDVIKECKETDWTSSSNIDLVEAFLDDPLSWSESHGGSSSFSSSLGAK